jgi:hypothetical protein
MPLCAVVAAALPIQAATQQPQELRLHGRHGGLILHDGATVPLVMPGVAGATTQMCCILWPPCCQFNLYCHGRFIRIGLCCVATPVLLVAY